MKLLKFFVALSLVADTLGSDHYQEKQIQKFLEKNVKKVTRNIGWELLFAAGETNQNKGLYTGYNISIHKTYFKVISPLSITGAMYMLAAGSKGATQSEILNKERFPSMRHLRKRPRKIRKVLGQVIGPATLES